MPKKVAKVVKKVKEVKEVVEEVKDPRAELEIQLANLKEVQVFLGDNRISSLGDLERAIKALESQLALLN